jgi:bifunctional non-homologous end joining protein LigD
MHAFEVRPASNDWEFQTRCPRSALEARIRARRAAAKGPEAARDAMGKPGLIGRVWHLRGEEDLRHASLQDFRVE